MTAKQAFRLRLLFVLLCKLITSRGKKVRESVPAVTHLDCAWILRAKKDKKERKMGRLAVKRLDNDTENQT